MPISRETIGGPDFQTTASHLSSSLTCATPRKPVDSLYFSLLPEGPFSGHDQNMDQVAPNDNSSKDNGFGRSILQVGTNKPQGHFPNGCVGYVQTRPDQDSDAAHEGETSSSAPAASRARGLRAGLEEEDALPPRRCTGLGDEGQRLLGQLRGRSGHPKSMALPASWVV